MKSFSKTSIFLIFTISLFVHDLANAQTQKGIGLPWNDYHSQWDWITCMPDENTIAITGKNIYDNHSNDEAGRVTIYKWDSLSKNWISKGNAIKGNNFSNNMNASISMPDSNTIAIGYPYFTGVYAKGVVRIYKWDGTQWNQKGIDIDGESVDDQFGNSVSMSDSNTIAIGGHTNNNGGIAAGHVRIFQWNGSVWSQKGINIDGTEANGMFGNNVYMSDSNTVAISGRKFDTLNKSIGLVKVYKWENNIWQLKGNIFESLFKDDGFGGTICMPDSNTLAIGAPADDQGGWNAGMVQIFVWNNSSWLQKGNDIYGNQWDLSGNSISMPDENTIAIGATMYNSGYEPGLVRIFKWNGNNWLQNGNDVLGPTSDSHFGWCVSMPTPNTFAASVESDGGTGENFGFVKVYEFLSTPSMINNFKNNLQFSIYPIPSSEILNIEIKHEIEKVEIIDISGKVSLTIYGNIKQVNLKMIPVGSYFLKVYTNDGVGFKSFTKK